MDGAKEVLRSVHPSDWRASYDMSRRLSADISNQGWPERCRRLSDEIGRIVHEGLGPRGVIAIVGGRRSDSRRSIGGIAPVSGIEQTALFGKAMVTAVLLQLTGPEGVDIGVPSTVEHALTLSLTLVPTWGHAAQALLERRDHECDDVLTTLPGYMLLMLADDYGRLTTRSDRVRNIWMRGLSDLNRTGPFSLTIH